MKRGLVLEPKRWAWSSFRHYDIGERGPVLVNETQKADLSVRKSPDVGVRGVHLSKSAKDEAAKFG